MMYLVHPFKRKNLLRKCVVLYFRASGSIFTEWLIDILAQKIAQIILLRSAPQDSEYYFTGPIQSVNLSISIFIGDSF